MVTAFFNDFETYELILIFLLLIAAPRTRNTAILLFGLSSIVTLIDLSFNSLNFLVGGESNTADFLLLSMDLAFLFITILAINNTMFSPMSGVEQAFLLYFIDGFVEMLMTTTNLFDGFISIIGFSLALYVSIVDLLQSGLAREAAIKYFYLSALSSGLIIMGIFNIIMTTLESDIFLIEVFINTHAHYFYQVNLLAFGLFFLLFGFFFKLSAFPGHLWAPEIYEGSSAPVMTSFMTIIKVAVFLFLIKLLVISFGSFSNVWGLILNFSTLGSLLWGGLAAFTETRLKRFFAYTSINQMGFLFFGLICNTDQALDLTLFYFASYILASAALNYVLFDSYIVSRTVHFGVFLRPVTFLTDLTGVASKINSVLPLWTITAILFSMIGVPPLLGFFTKYFLLMNLFEQGHIVLLFVGLLTSLISVYYYLRIIKTIWFEQPIFTSPLSMTFLLLPDFFVTNTHLYPTLLFFINVLLSCFYFFPVI